MQQKPITCSHSDPDLTLVKILNNLESKRVTQLNIVSFLVS